jgi:hypothetical protein
MEYDSGTPVLSVQFPEKAGESESQEVSTDERYEV